MNMYLVWLEYCFHGNLKDYITRNREYFINEEQNTEFNIRTVRVRGGEGREEFSDSSNFVRNQQKFASSSVNM